MGGDEFVLLLDGMTKRRQLDEAARRIITDLEVPVEWEGQLCRISGSAGTAITTEYDQRVITGDTLLMDADLALYASKEAGRGRHTFYSEDLPRLAS